MDQQQAMELARTLHMTGGVVGGLCGVLGALAGVLAPRGKGKPIVVGGFVLFMLIGVVGLIGGGVLAMRGVPFVAYWPALLIGFILLTVLGSLFPVVLKRYREADVRRLEAAALRQS